MHFSQKKIVEENSSDNLKTRIFHSTIPLSSQRRKFDIYVLQIIYQLLGLKCRFTFDEIDEVKKHIL